MTNSSLADLDAAENYYKDRNNSGLYEYPEDVTFSNVEWILWVSITSIICCFGLVGNGYIIWLLGFQIKRNCFTTFILNLAVADFGYLASLVISYIPAFIDFLGNKILSIFCTYVFQMMYISANFILTALSIDRCVAVLFPMWHRCSRPKHLSSMVCAPLWISSSLLCGIMTIMDDFLKYSILNFHYLVCAIVCLPLITLSTMVLFIKMCVKPKQKNKSRLLLMILIALLCFLILSFPSSVIAVLVSFSSTKHDLALGYWLFCSVLFSCLNSSINPVIYFLVGRKRGSRSKESIKIILRNAFKEGEATGGK